MLQLLQWVKYGKVTHFAFLAAIYPVTFLTVTDPGRWQLWPGQMEGIDQDIEQFDRECTVCAEMKSYHTEVKLCY